MKTWINEQLDKLKRSIEKKWRKWLGQDGKPDKPAGADGWRDGRDLDTLQAVNGVIRFETRNVMRPTGPNLPGDAEWIIARIEGRGFSRLLIMTMAGNRPPSRLYFDGAEINGKYPVPDAGPTSWEVNANDGLQVIRNNVVIHRFAGGYTVERAVMTGYHRRGFLGQWRAA